MAAEEVGVNEAAKSDPMKKEELLAQLNTFPKDRLIEEVVSMWEELGELEQAMKAKDLKEVADALTDILYVTYGAGCAYGIDLDKCFKEVQRANMSKLDEDGKPIYNDKGKVMKGPNYSAPNLNQFIK